MITQPTTYEGVILHVWQTTYIILKFLASRFVIDLSWILIAILVTWSLAKGVFSLLLRKGYRIPVTGGNGGLLGRFGLFGSNYLS